MKNYGIGQNFSYQDIAKKNLSHALTLLSGLYLVFSLGHYFLPSSPILLAATLSTSVILIALRVFFKYFIKTSLRTYILVFSIVLLSALNSNLYIYVTHDIKQSVYIIFIIFACGIFLFSRSSYWYWVSIVFFSWALTIQEQEYSSSEKIHYIYFILTSIVLAYLILMVRLASYSKIEFLYRKNKLKNQSLEKALKSLQLSNKMARKEKNKALKESQLKSQFVANMSHEIRTPLNAVIGLTDMMLQTKINSKQKNYLRLLQNAGDSLLHLINDILDFSKIEAHEVNIHESTFNLYQLLGEIKEAFNVQIDQKKIDLKIHIAPNIPKSLMGDSHRVKQILNNLTSNAVKFTEEGEVILKAEEAHTTKLKKTIKGSSNSFIDLKFSVSDTGPGVPIKKQETVFEQYIQSDNTISKRFGGTGLGLAICKKLVENMKGKIGLISPIHKDTKKAGSLFWFQLRFRAINESVEQRDIRPLRKYKAIVVDNLFPEPAQFFADLKSLGFEIKFFKESEHDLVKGALDQDSILFLHAGLKELNSFRYISSLREENLQIPIAVYSTLKMRGDDEKAQLSGADLYLKLPIKIHVLERNLQVAVKKYRHKSSQPLPKTVKKPKVLIAEDNEVNQLLIKTLLEKQGAKVSMVSNGKEALKSALSNEYDLIFMDISMPEMNGYQVSRSLRKKKVKTPIIALTAHAFQETQEKCSSSGMNGFISKPYQNEEIAKVFESYVLNAKPSE